MNNLVRNAATVGNTQAERSRAQVKVLSGFDKLYRDTLHQGFSLVRIQAENEKDLKMSYTWIHDEQMRILNMNRKHAMIRSMDGPHDGLRKMDTLTGSENVGDVFNPAKEAYFGNTRARHSVEVRATDLKHMMFLAVAWAEYMSFTQSSESIGFLSKVNKLNQEKKMLFVELQAGLASSQPDVASVQNIVGQIQTLETSLEKLHDAYQTLLQDAQPFIQTRVAALKAHAELECDRDVHAEREFHVCPETLPPVTMDVVIDGDIETVELMNLSAEEYESMFDTMGINDIENALNGYYTDSPNRKNTEPTMKDGSTVKVDASTRPFLKADMRFNEEGTVLTRSGIVPIVRDALGLGADEGKKVERDLQI